MNYKMAIKPVSIYERQNQLEVWSDVIGSIAVEDFISPPSSSSSG